MKGASKVAVIVTFLVVLELIKTGFVIVEQEGTCEEIYITVTEGSGTYRRNYRRIINNTAMLYKF